MLHPSEYRRLTSGDFVLDLSRPIIMGILNITPDSFSDGGQLLNAAEQLNHNKMLQKVQQMIIDGAAIIDVGGESTRPGAVTVSVQQEMDRVLPVIESIRREFNVMISVDTSTPQVMTESARLGANIINDVRALEREGAVEAAASTGLPICLMHMQGSPQTMQQQPHYGDILEDIIGYLQSRINSCLAAGISLHQIIVDPGFGFGKTDAHNLRLLNELAEFKVLGCPILVGLSRKSLIGRLLNRDVNKRLPASLALALIAVMNGAAILRVHDIAETADVMAMYEAVKHCQAV